MFQLVPVGKFSPDPQIGNRIFPGTNLPIIICNQLYFVHLHVQVFIIGPSILKQHCVKSCECTCSGQCMRMHTVICMCIVLPNAQHAL